MIFELRGNFLEFNNVTVTGKTAVYGLIGDPVDHSMSPTMQNAAFRSTGIDAVYVPFQVRASTLKSAVQGLRALGVRGFNVTTPHKVNVIRHLEKLDRVATRIGSVNTVINKSGTLFGYSTDGIGALNALREAGAPLDGQSLLLFGAGGSSRAIAHTLAPQIKSIHLVNRSLSKASQLARKLRQEFETPIACEALSTAPLRQRFEEADLIVNASSMGMCGRVDPPIREGWLRRDQWVFDLVYEPVETKLLKIASLAGASVVTGLDMLLHQGACSFQLWTGRNAPILEMRNAIAQKMPAMAHAESS